MRCKVTIGNQVLLEYLPRVITKDIHCLSITILYGGGDGDGDGDDSYSNNF